MIRRDRAALDGDHREPPGPNAIVSAVGASCTVATLTVTGPPMVTLASVRARTRSLRDLSRCAVGVTVGDGHLGGLRGRLLCGRLLCGRFSVAWAGEDGDSNEAENGD